MMCGYNSDQSIEAHSSNTDLTSRLALISTSGISNNNLTLPSLPPDYINLYFPPKEPEAVPEVIDNENACPFPLATQPPTFAKVVKASKLTNSNDVKMIIELGLESEGSSFNFLPGDTIGIIPQNSENDVVKLLKCLDILDCADKTVLITIKPDTLKKKAHIPPYIPPCSTIRHIVQSCLEIRGVPKKILLRVMSHHTSDPREKHRLEELSSREGAADYTKLVLEARVSFLDVLQAFPTCIPPFERLLELLPRLQARPYSVASSPLPDACRFHIVFSVPEPRPGVCTGWLLRTMPLTLEQQLATLSIVEAPDSCKVPFFWRKTNSFRVPEDMSIPLILIGPGTGIAPFIGFLQHRAAIMKDLPSNTQCGEIWLFFGCRHHDKDFIYKTELEGYCKTGVLTRLFTSFSRDVAAPDKPKYVQDNIRIHSKEFVKQLLDKDSIVFVCGDAKKMARDVMSTIVDVIQHEKGISKDEALSTIQELQRNSKYLQDIWL